MNKKDDNLGKVPPAHAETNDLKSATHGEAATEADGNPEPDVDLGNLGSQLRKLYKELLEQPIPDRFTKLLEDLDGKEPGKQ
jgi:hypothetical protein